MPDRSNSPIKEIGVEQEDNKTYLNRRSPDVFSSWQGNRAEIVTESLMKSADFPLSKGRGRTGYAVLEHANQNRQKDQDEGYHSFKLHPLQPGLQGGLPRCMTTRLPEWYHRLVTA